jgi:chromosome segregation ATPase
VERLLAEIADARRAQTDSQQALDEARGRLDALERDLEGRPTAALVEELQAAVEGHAARAAAREAELEAVREAAEAQVAEAQEGFAKQQAFANDLAATLYDTRVELGALRAVNVEQTDALGVARDELARVRDELERRPTPAQVAALRAKVGDERRRRDGLAEELARATGRLEELETTLRRHQRQAERLSSTLRLAGEEAAALVPAVDEPPPPDESTTVEDSSRAAGTAETPAAHE